VSSKKDIELYLEGEEIELIGDIKENIVEMLNIIDKLEELDEEAKEVLSETPEYQNKKETRHNLTRAQKFLKEYRLANGYSEFEGTES